MNLSKKIFMALFSFWVATVAGKREVIHLATGEWAPYISKRSASHGVISQIVSESFLLEKITVELHFYPWQRVAQLSKEGRVDGVIAYAKTVEREKYLLFSNPIYTGKYVFFHLKKRKFAWKSYQDLSDLLLASTRGFGGMGKGFLKAEKDKVLKVLRLNSDEQSFKMLRRGRVDAVPSDMEVGYNLLFRIFKSENNQIFTHHPKIISESHYRLAVPIQLKKSKRLIQIFNRGLKKLKKSGRYDEIVNRHQKGFLDNFMRASTKK